MKTISLTQNQVTLVDDDMFDYLNQWKWYAHKERGGFYALRTFDDLRMHRLIMNAQKGQQIDHHNNNSLDNQKYNLRFCTNTQNLQNSRKRKNCSSQYKGVCWAKSKKKWQSNIGTNQKLLFLGRFNTAIEAAKIYDAKAKELFGEFARTNF